MKYTTCTHIESFLRGIEYLIYCSVTFDYTHFTLADTPEANMKSLSHVLKCITDT